MIKGIIFDKDGILFNSEPYYARTSQEVLKEFGIDLSEQDYYDHWTKKGKKLIDFLKEKNKESNYDEIIKIRSNLLCKILPTIPLIEGAMNTIKSLYEIYPLALVTSGHKENTRLMLKSSGIKKYFKYVIMSEDVKKGKPDPEGFLLASKYLGIKPKNLVVIEDAEKGIIAANKAGMKSIAIPTKYTLNNDFSLATKILTNISEITPELIRSL